MPVEIIKEGGGGGNVVLGVILGALLLGVAIVGFFMWDNFKSGGAHTGPVVHMTVKP